jgi:hypothetical protein
MRLLACSPVRLQYSSAQWATERQAGRRHLPTAPWLRLRDAGLPRPRVVGHVDRPHSDACACPTRWQSAVDQPVDQFGHARTLRGPPRGPLTNICEYLLARAVVRRSVSSQHSRRVAAADLSLCRSPLMAGVGPGREQIGRKSPGRRLATGHAHLRGGYSASPGSRPAEWAARAPLASMHLEGTQFRVRPLCQGQVRHGARPPSDLWPGRDRIIYDRDLDHRRHPWP